MLPMRIVPVPGRHTATLLRATLVFAVGWSMACRSDPGLPEEPVEPSISGLNPSSIEAGSVSFTLRVSGTGFTDRSEVRWNGSVRTTRQVGAQLEADIPEQDVATEGSATVRVANPSPAGQSAGIDFVIRPATVASIEIVVPPGQITAGQNVRLTAIPRSASNRDLTASRSGCITWTSSDTALAIVNSTGSMNALTGGSVTITAACEAVRTTVVLAINNPAPTIGGLTPQMPEAGSAAFNMTVTGTGFVRTSVVRVSGTAKITRYVSSTELRADVTAQDVAAPGTLNITVLNPTPGGGASSGTQLLVAAGTGFYSESPPFFQPDVETLIGTFAGSGGNLVDFAEDNTTSAEGTRSMRIIMRASGLGFVGWFIGWGNATRIADQTFTRDMSAYAGGSLRFWARSTTELEIGIRSGNVPAGAETSKVLLTVVTSFVRNGQWQGVCIPLSRFTGASPKADLAQMKVFFVLAVNSATLGTGGANVTVNIDDVRWDRRPCPS